MIYPINSPAKPHLVWVRNPIVSSHVLVLCDPATLDKVMELGSKRKLGEYWGLVHGNPGPMPDGLAPVETDGLKAPRAIFRGLKRPLHYLHPDADTDVFVYVTSSDYTYCYRPSRHGDAVMPEPKPIDSVFTTFVSFNPHHINEAVAPMRQTPSDRPVGVVLFWEWTESAPDDPSLPYDSTNRYGSRML